MIKNIRSIYKNREIVKIFTGREIKAKYKGSLLGILWAIINPLIMLIIYTLVFSQVFKGRWGTDAGNTTESTLIFAMEIFAGLIVFNMFSESISKSTTQITSNPNFVKKIIFPLEILSTATIGSALFHGSIGMIILILGKITITGTIEKGIILLPIVWIPYSALLLGISWILSVVGVYIKDLSQLVNSGISGMMFLSPIFYPTEALPNSFRWIGNINPLSYVMEETRSLLFEGRIERLNTLIAFMVVSTLVCEVGYRIIKEHQQVLGDYL